MGGRFFQFSALEALLIALLYLAPLLSGASLLAVLVHWKLRRPWSRRIVSLAALATLGLAVLVPLGFAASGRGGAAAAAFGIMLVISLPAMLSLAAAHRMELASDR